MCVYTHTHFYLLTSHWRVLATGLREELGGIAISCLATFQLCVTVKRENGFW